MRRLELGEPEIEELDLALGSQHDIGGLDISMHDARLVGGVESIRQGESDPLRFSHLEGADLQALGQGLARIVGHGDPGPPAVLPDLEDRPDTRGIESGCGPRFALETVPGRWDWRPSLWKMSFNATGRSSFESVAR